MADNFIQPFSNQKPGPISETWKCIFALEKRLQYTCNTEDNFRRKLTEIDIRKRELEKEYQNVELDRAKNLQLRKSLNIKVSLKYRNLATLSKIEEDKENEMINKSFDSYFSATTPTTATTSTVYKSVIKVLTHVKSSNTR